MPLFLYLLSRGHPGITAAITSVLMMLIIGKPATIRSATRALSGRISCTSLLHNDICFRFVPDDLIPTAWRDTSFIDYNEYTLVGSSTEILASSTCRGVGRGGPGAWPPIKSGQGAKKGHIFWPYLAYQLLTNIS